jgi:hypothetical protein
MPKTTKQMPGWMADFQHAHSDLDQIKLIGRGAFTRKQLVEMTQYSQLGTVLTEIWKQITCDLNVGEETYRFHDGRDDYVIKRRTFGPDGNSYGGWSFHEKFPKSRAGKESALEAWIDLAAEGTDWNERGADAGTINPGGDVDEIETNQESEPMAKKIGMQAIDEMCLKQEQREQEQRRFHVEKSKSATMEHLQSIADQLNEKTERFNVVEKEATMLMLEIGITIEWVKEQLPHGQLEKWVNANLTISKSHARRFRQLAQVFIRANTLKPDECFLLCDPANSKEALGEKLRQMAFDFLGDKTQAELFEQYKIKYQEPKKLTYHPPKPVDNPTNPIEGLKLSAHKDWIDVYNTLCSLGDSWMHLVPNEKAALFDLLETLTKKIGKAVAKGA